MPEGKASIGPPLANGKRLYVTSAFIKQALDKGHEAFRWDERKALPKRSGTKARGIGVATSCFVGGSVGFDGLFVIKPDGKIYCPVGRGIWERSRSVTATGWSRKSWAFPGRNAEITWGHTGRNLPWTCPSRRQPDHARYDARSVYYGPGRQRQIATDRGQGSWRHRRPWTWSGTPAPLRHDRYRNSRFQR